MRTKLVITTAALLALAIGSVAARDASQNTPASGYGSASSQGWPTDYVIQRNSDFQLQGR
jgi:hypothetical protein